MWSDSGSIVNETTVMSLYVITKVGRRRQRCRRRRSIFITNRFEKICKNRRCYISTFNPLTSANPKPISPIRRVK